MRFPSYYSLCLPCFILVLLCYSRAFGEALLKKEQVQIGVIAPLTGGQAKSGEDIRRTLDILGPYFSKKSRKYEYRFLLEDGKCGAGNAAISAAKKLIHFQKVAFMLSGCSGETLQIADSTTRNHVLLIAVLSSHQDIKKLGDSVYRTYIDQAEAMVSFASFLQSRGHKRLGLFTEENAFTYGIKELLVQELGDTLKMTVDFPADSYDYNSMLTKAHVENLDGIIFNPLSDGSLSELLKQSRQMGLQQQIYATNSNPEHAGFIARTGQASRGLIYPGNPTPTQSSKAFQETLSTYFKKYPEGPSFETLVRTTFDAVQSLVDGIETHGPSAGQVARFLQTYHSKGAFGDLEYDANGDMKNIHYVIREILHDGSTKEISFSNHSSFLH